MTAIAFDTHIFVKRLTSAGMVEPLAEAVISLVKEAQVAAAGGVATKGDFREETAPIKAELLLIKWMLGSVLAFQIAIFLKTFIH
ncbi:MAG: hypothetical protein WCK65_10735 [Rhodospirillaceae bacterium]